MAHVASHNDEMKKCIEECQNCHATCLETIRYCLEKGGKHAAPDHIQSLSDCAEACQFSADFMLTSSPLHHLTCGVCAQACQRCEASCRSLGGDEQMDACAARCRSCADSCRTMSGGFSAAA